MGPKSTLSLLGPSDHGGAGGRLLKCPFQGLPGSNAGRPPLTHTLQCVGGRSRHALAENHGGEGYRTGMI